ncbi:hypothetical protein [Pyxidicoccus trucidator]|uniref:hypothetical protein n=1 Tax=Pyxidicoccus trucidator TaxID=2709662 RepID=UPI0013D92398|nr:hypothetical protein [Pyxidicoccus trucidator]
MREHLSDLVLDEVMAGGPRPPHLETCDACQGRLSRLRTHAEQTRAAAAFSRVRAQVLAEAAARQARPATSWFSGWLLVPALATLVIGVFRGPLMETVRGPTVSDGREVPTEPGPGIRVKGPPSVELLRLEDGQVNPVLHEGDEVALRLRSGGRRYALVVSVDTGGQVEALWPLGAQESGELDVEQPAPLFQVTRGGFVVHALYSETPLRLDDLRDWLATHGPDCSGATGTSACQEPTGLPAGSAHAAVSLGVEASR